VDQVFKDVGERAKQATEAWAKEAEEKLKQAAEEMVANEQAAGAGL
jgi:hypothetical protein